MGTIIYLLVLLGRDPCSKELPFPSFNNPHLSLKFSVLYSGTYEWLLFFQVFQQHAGGLVAKFGKTPRCQQTMDNGWWRYNWCYLITRKMSKVNFPVFRPHDYILGQQIARHTASTWLLETGPRITWLYMWERSWSLSAPVVPSWRWFSRSLSPLKSSSGGLGKG